jgi:hypothetical protein
MMMMMISMMMMILASVACDITPQKHATKYECRSSQLAGSVVTDIDSDLDIVLDVN